MAVQVLIRATGLWEWVGAESCLSTLRAFGPTETDEDNEPEPDAPIRGDGEMTIKVMTKNSSTLSRHPVIAAAYHYSAVSVGLFTSASPHTLSNAPHDGITQLPRHQATGIAAGHCNLMGPLMYTHPT